MFSSNLFILTLLTTSSSGQNDIRLLSGILQTMLADVIKPEAMTLSIIGNTRNLLVADILDDLLKRNTKVEVPIAINRETSAELGNYIQTMLIFVEDSEEIRQFTQSYNLLSNIKPEISQFLIILNRPSNLIQYHEEMRKIFKYFFYINLIEINILTFKSNYVEVHTFYPFSSDCCSCVRPTLMRRFREVPKSLKYTDVFPAKTNNFFQCPISVVLWNLPPFVEVLNRTNGSVVLQGFDASILGELSKTLNFSIKLVPNEPPEYIGGTVYDNNTATGVFKLLVDRRADLTLGCLTCMENRFKLASASSSYFIVDYVIILRTTLKFTTFDLLIVPFKLSTWYLIIVVTALKIIMKSIFRLKLRIRANFRKLYSLLWIFFVFILRISYEGSMFKAITNPPYEPQPQTIETLVKENYTIVSDYATVRILEHIPLVKQITRVVPGTPAQVLELLDNLPQRTGILTTNALVATFMRKRLERHSEYTLLGQKISNGLKCIYFPKHSFLTPVLNNILLKINHFGFGQKYAAAIGLENLPHTTDKWLGKRRVTEDTVLDDTFLHSVCIGLCYANTCAFCIFLIEILCYRFGWLITRIYK